MTPDDRLTHLLDAGRYADAERECRRRLRENGTDAAAWHVLARVLAARGLREASRLADERAQILDPRQVAEPAPAGDGAQARGGAVPVWLSALLAVPRVRVEAAMIVRDEALSIGEAIRRLRPAVDRVVVADTGSQDATVTFAREAGADVITIPWTDHFADARNRVLSEVRGDWVLWVDGDEWLDPEDVEVPRLVAGVFHRRRPVPILRIVHVNHLSGSPADPGHDSDADRVSVSYEVARMFPTDAGLCWRGRVHEQVGFCDGREPVPDALSWPLVRIRLHHHGYAPDVITRRGKLARNIRLLRLQLQDEPDDAVAMGFLGRELYLAGELDEAVAVLEQAEQRLAERPRYGRLSEVRAYLAEALLKLGRAEEAFGVTTRALAHQPGYPTSWFLRGQASLRMAVTHLAEARAAFQQAQAAARSYQGDLGFDPEVGGFKSLLALADVAKLEGRWDEAIRGYRAARPHVADPAPLDRQIAVMAEMAHRVVTLAGDRTSRHDEDGPGGAGPSSGTGTATS